MTRTSGASLSILGLNNDPGGNLTELSFSKTNFLTSPVLSGILLRIMATMTSYNDNTNANARLTLMTGRWVMEKSWQIRMV